MARTRNLQAQQGRTLTRAARKAARRTQARKYASTLFAVVLAISMTLPTPALAVISDGGGQLSSSATNQPSARLLLNNGEGDSTGEGGASGTDTYVNKIEMLWSPVGPNTNGGAGENNADSTIRTIKPENNKPYPLSSDTTKYPYQVQAQVNMAFSGGTKIAPFGAEVRITAYPYPEAENNGYDPGGPGLDPVTNYAKSTRIVAAGSQPDAQGRYQWTEGRNSGWVDASQVYFDPSGVGHVVPDDLGNSNYFTFIDTHGTSDKADDELVVVNANELDPAHENGFTVSWNVPKASLLTDGDTSTTPGTDNNITYGNTNPNGQLTYSNNIQATVSLKEAKPGEATSRTSNSIKMLVDTGVSMERNDKKKIDTYDSWQSSWGTAPADANDYIYILWAVQTKVAETVTQAFTVDFNDQVNTTINKVEESGGSAVKTPVQDNRIHLVGYGANPIAGLTPITSNSFGLSDIQKTMVDGLVPNASITVDAPDVDVRHLYVYDSVVVAYPKNLVNDGNTWEISNTVTNTLTARDDGHTEQGSAAGTTQYAQMNFTTPEGPFDIEKRSYSPYQRSTNDIVGGFEMLANDIPVETKSYRGKGSYAGYNLTFGGTSEEDKQDPSKYGLKSYNAEFIDDTMYLGGQSKEGSYNIKLEQGDYELCQLYVNTDSYDWVPDLNTAAYELKKNNNLAEPIEIWLTKDGTSYEKAATVNLYELDSMQLASGFSDTKVHFSQPYVGSMQVDFDQGSEWYGYKIVAPTKAAQLEISTSGYYWILPSAKVKAFAAKRIQLYEDATSAASSENFLEMNIININTLNVEQDGQSIDLGEKFESKDIKGKISLYANELKQATYNDDRGRWSHTQMHGYTDNAVLALGDTSSFRKSFSRFSSVPGHDYLKSHIELRLNKQLSVSHSNFVEKTQDIEPIFRGILEDDPNWVEQSGRFYDLLPEGVNPDMSTFKLTQATNNSGNPDPDGGNSFTYQVIRNWNNTGRTMVIVDVFAGPDNYSITRSSYDFLTSSFTAEFDAYIDHDVATALGYRGAGDVIVNEAAYRSGNNSFPNGSPDDGVAKGTEAGSRTEFPLFNNLDPESDQPRFRYTEAKSQTPLYNTAYEGGIDKAVMGPDDITWRNGHEAPSSGMSPLLVSAGDEYAYRLRLSTTSGTSIEQPVIYDDIEGWTATAEVPYVDDTGATVMRPTGVDQSLIGRPQWRGTFQNIDLSQIAGKNYKAVVYIHSGEPLDIAGHHNLQESTSWDGPYTEEQINNLSDNEKAAIRAIAIDMRYDAQEQVQTIPENTILYAIVNMKAPEGEEYLRHWQEVPGEGSKALNQVYHEGQFRDTSTAEPTNRFIHNEFTMVGLAAPPTGTMLIQKTHAGQPDATDPVYTFVVSQQVGGQTLYYEGTYDILDAQTGAVRTSNIPASPGGCVSINAGQVARISPAIGQGWKVTEETPGTYYTTTVQNATVGIANPNAKPSDIAYGEAREGCTSEEFTIEEDKTYGVNFTNTYAPEGSLEVIKTLSGGAADSEKLFEFVITLTEGEGATTIPYANKSVTLSGTGAQGTSYTTDTEGRIRLSFTGNKSVVVGGIPNGIRYTVEETQANTDGYTTTATNTEGIIETDATKQANFVNSKPSAGQVDFVAVKTTSGGTLSPTGFTFELVDSETDNVLQTKTVAEGNTVTFDPITYTAIGRHTYTIREKIPEGATNEAGVTYAQRNNTTPVANGPWKLNGVQYDTREHSVDVVVTQDGGALKAEMTYRNSNGEIEKAPTFENTYTTTNISVELKAKKSLQGHRLNDRGFTFCAELYTSAGAHVSTVDFDADGTATFKNLDALTYNAPGTYYYYLREKLPEGVSAENPEKDGITYDSRSVRVQVDVRDDGKGALGVENVQYAGEETEPTFTNTYNATGTVNIPVSKQLSGRDWAAGEGFEFTLTSVTNDAPMPADASGNTATTTVENTGEANANGSYTGFFAPITYPLSLLAGQPYDSSDGSRSRTYTYSVKETRAGNNIDGVTYDGQEYYIDVVITDRGTGTIETDVTYRGRTQSTGSGTDVGSTGPTFTNIYEPKPAKASIEATKNLVGRNWAENDSFEFVLAAGGNNIASGEVANPMPQGAMRVGGNMQKSVAATKGTEDASEPVRSVDFGEMTFTHAGEYYYTIVETTPENGLVASPTATQQVTVVVTDDGKGQLHAQVGYGASNSQTPVQITNTYTPGNTSVQLHGKKTLNGAAPANKSFEFRLYNANHEYLTNATQDAQGNITSPVLNFGPDDMQGVSWEADGEGGVKRTKAITYYVREVIPNAAVLVTSDGSHDEGVTYGAAADSAKIANCWFADGVTYDGSEKKIVVSLTDDGKGNLTATVAYDDGQPSPADNQPESTWPVLENSYEANGQATVYATKAVLPSSHDWENDSFSFELLDSNGQRVGNLQTATHSNPTVDFDVLDYELQDLDEATSKTFEYTIREYAATSATDATNANDGSGTYTKDGYTYAADVPVRVTVTDQGNGQLTCAVTYGQGAGSPVTPTLTNRYSTGHVDVLLRAGKALSGRDWKEGDSFGFTLARADATSNAPLPENEAERNVAITYADATATPAVTSKTFGVITFTEPGRYYYLVSENLPAEGEDGVVYTRNAQGRLSGVVKDGVSYDIEAQRVEVVVTDNGDGTLSAQTNYEDEANQASFTNVYKASPYTLELKGSKTLVGRNLVEGRYSFELIDMNAQTPAGEENAAYATSISNATNGADGSFTSQPIVYAEPGTYTYIGREVIPTGAVLLDANGTPAVPEQTYANTRAAWQAAVRTNTNARIEGNYLDKATGIVYDGNDKTITVQVTDNFDGTLSAAATYDGEAEPAPYANKYVAEGTAQLQVTKEISGRDWIAEGANADSFTFTLTPLEGAPAPTSDTATANADNKTANWSGIRFTEGDIGKTFDYRINEVEGSAGGMAYNTSNYYAHISVRDAGDGTLAFDVTYSGPEEHAGQGDWSNVSSSLTITNTYTAQGTASLKAKKLISDSSGAAPALQGGKFSFELVDAAGNVVETKQNDAQGNVAFNALTYTLDDLPRKAYSVREVIPNDAVNAAGQAYASRAATGATGPWSKDGYTYSEALHGINVELTDNGNGSITATPEYSQGASEASFTNLYGAETSVQLEVEKHLDGRPILPAGFRFEVFDMNATLPDGTANPAYNTAIRNATVAPAEGANDKTTATGLFGAIPFSAAGTYTYEVREVVGTNAAIDYDTVVVPVVVTVEADGSGGLNVISVTYNNSENADTTTQNKTDKAYFTNIYKATGEVAVPFTKDLSGRAWNTGETFSFTLVPNAGSPALRDADGAQLQGENNKLNGVANANGQFDISAIRYDISDLPDITTNDRKTGTFTYTLSEDIPASASQVMPDGKRYDPATGIIYDTSVYEITVVATDTTEGSIATTITQVVKKTADGLPDANVPTASFANAYQARPITATVDVTKVLSGRTGEWLDTDSFTFTIDSTNAPLPSNTQGQTNKATVDKNSANHTASFEAITYTAADMADAIVQADGTRIKTFDYAMSEDAPQGATLNRDGEYVKDGITYTTGTHSAHVTVKDDGQGNLSVVSVRYGATRSETPAVFTNLYTPEDTSTVFTGTKNMVGRAFISGHYYVELLVANERFEPQESLGSTPITATTQGEGTIETRPVSFSQAGMYYYIVREHIPADATNEAGTITYGEANTGLVRSVAGPWFKDGVRYDGHETRITVEVKDTGTGALEVDSITYNNATEGVADADKNTTSGIALTNTYTADPAYAVLQATKAYRSDSWQNKSFTFTLAAGNNTAGEGVQTPVPQIDGSPATSVVVTEDSPTGVFESIRFTQPGIYEYVISEAIPANARLLGDDGKETATTYEQATDAQKTGGLFKTDGVVYDSAPITAQVQVSDSGTGQLVASVTYNGMVAGNRVFGGQAAASIVNRYQPTGTANVQVAKTIAGRSWNGDEFAFKISAATPGAPMPNVAADGTGLPYDTVSITGTSAGRNQDDPTNDNAKTATFENLVFTAAGTYVYRVQEVVPNDAVDAAGQTYGSRAATGATGPWTKDGITYADYTQSVTVYVEDTHTGTLTTRVEYGADSIWPQAFANGYQAHPASTNLRVQKELEGRSLSANAYNFELYEGSLVVDSTTGKVLSRPISTAVNAANGTATFDTLTFTSEMLADGVLGADGQRSKEFIYTIREVVPPSAVKVVEEADGTTTELVFADAAFEQQQAGGFVYNGVVYDAVVYTARVTATDNGHGSITVDNVSYQREGSILATDPVFNNVYVSEGTLDLPVSKVISGRSWKSSDTFSFTLTPLNGAPAPAVREADDGSEQAGNVVVLNANKVRDFFGTITFNAAGTYTYEVREDQPSDDGIAGITYDDSTVVVTVDVRDNGTGTLVPRVSAERVSANGQTTAISAVSFTNTYTASPARASILVAKVLEGRDWKRAEAYSFTLAAQGNTAGTETPMPSEQGGNVATVAAANGQASFGEISFDAPGVYTYTVRENLPEGVSANNPTKDGVTYDTQVRTVRVIVTDENNNGQLSARVEGAQGSQATTFTNTYTAEPVTVPLGAIKRLDGNVPNYGQFSFYLYRGQDEGDHLTTDEVGNSATGANGYASLGSQTFTRPGVYHYVIAEYVPGGAQVDANGDTIYDGIIYDTRRIGVTIDVKDDGNGKLYVDGGVVYTDTTAEADQQQSNDVPVFNNKTAESGNLSIKKSVTGDAANTGRNFTVRVWLADDEGTPLTRLFPYQRFDDESDEVIESGYVTNGSLIPIRHGQTITISGLPAGANNVGYTVWSVEEVFADANQDGYTVTWSGDGVDEVIDGKPSGSIPQDNEEDIVIFRNDKPGDGTATVTASKSFDGTPPAYGLYQFTLQPVGENAEDAPLPVAGDGITVDEQTRIATVGNIEGGRISFGDLTFDAPGVYRYEVREVAGDNNSIAYDNQVYTLVVTVTYNAASDTKLQATAEWFDAEHALGNGVNPSFVNTTKGSLRIAKSVTGLDGNQNDTFDFTVSFADEEGNAVAGTFDYTGYGVENGTITNGGSITLSGGDYIIVRNLPLETVVTVTEADSDKGYSTSYKVDDAVDATEGMRASTTVEGGKAASIEFINDKAPDQPEIHKTSTVGKDNNEGRGSATNRIEVPAAGTFAYDISFTNTSDNAALENSLITDVIPEDLIPGATAEFGYYIEGEGTEDAPLPVNDGVVSVMRTTSHNLAFTITTLAAGKTMHLLVPVTVPARFAEVLYFDNQAELAWTGGTAKSETTYHVAEPPKGSVVLEKTVSGDVDPNATFRFEVDITDPANGNAVVEGIFPVAGDVAVGTTISHNGTLQLAAGQRVTISNLPAGANVQFSELAPTGYVVTANGSLGNSCTATVVSSGTVEVVFNNHREPTEPEIDKTSHVETDGQWDFDARGSQENPVEVNRGQHYTYDISVKNNNANLAIANAVVSDTIPSGLVIDKANITYAINGANERALDAAVALTRNAGQALAFTIANFEAGDTIHIYVPVTVPESLMETTIFENDATLSYNDGSDHELTSTPVFHEVEVGAVELAKTISGGVAASDVFTFRFATDDANQDLSYVLVMPDGSTVSIKSGESFQLQGGQRARINGLNDGVRASFAEVEASGYAVSYEVNGQPATDAAAVVSKGDVASIVVNNDKLIPATVNLTASKTLDGQRVARGAYSFTLTGLNGAPMPQEAPASSGQNASYTIENAAGGEIDFGPITYEQPGVYTYTVREVAGSNEGIAYDESVYTAHVTVMPDAATNSLRATLYWEADGKSLASVPEFANLSKGRLQIAKTVTGADGDTTKPFTFTARFLDAYGEELADSFAYTGKGVANGSLSSGDSFTLAHGQSITFDAMPPSAEVVVVEEAEDGYTTTYRINGGQETQDQTASTVVEPNAEARIDFTNDKPATPPEFDKHASNGDGSKASPVEVPLAGMFTYDLSFKNNNENEAMVDAVVTDRIPGGLTVDRANIAYYVGATAEAAANTVLVSDAASMVSMAEANGTYSFAVASLEAQQTIHLLIPVRVPSELAETVVYENTATLLWNGQSQQSRTTYHEAKVGDVELTKQVSGDINPAKAFAFTVDISGADVPVGPYRLVKPDGSEARVSSGDVVELSAGQTLRITGLPAGALVAFNETEQSRGDASVSYTANGVPLANSVLVAAGEVAKVVASNHKEPSVPEVDKNDPENTNSEGSHKGTPEDRIMLQVGQDFSYEITATNVNEYEAVNEVSITDVMPAGISLTGTPVWFVTDAFGGMVQPQRHVGDGVTMAQLYQVLTFNDISLGAGETIHIVLPVQVPADLAQATTYDNTVTLFWNRQTSGPVTVYHEVEEPPALGKASITKTVSGEASQTAEYAFTFSVSGQDVPQGAEYTYTTSTDETGTLASGATLTLGAGQTATVEGIPAGAVVSFAEAVPEGMQATYMVNNQRVDAEDAKATIVKDATQVFVVNNHQEPEAPKPDKTSSVGTGSAADPIVVNEDQVFTYDVLATNVNELTTIRDFTVVDRMPKTVIERQQPITWYVGNNPALATNLGGNVVLSGIDTSNSEYDTLSFAVGELAPGETLHILVPVKVASAVAERTVFENEAWINYNGESEHKFTDHVVEPKKGSVQLTKEASGDVDPLRSYTFTFEVDTLADQAYSWINSNGATGNVTSGDTLSLKAGEAITVEGLHDAAHVTFTETNHVGYSVSMNGQQAESATVAVKANETVKVAAVNTRTPENPPSIDKNASNGNGSAAAPVQVPEAGTFTYYLDVTNNNDFLAIENAVVTDTLPAGISATGPAAYSIDGQEVDTVRVAVSNDTSYTFTIAKLEAGKTVRIAIPVQVPASVASVQRFENTATLSWNGTRTETRTTYHEVAPKTGSVQLSKQVTGDASATEKFNFVFAVEDAPAGSEALEYSVVRNGVADGTIANGQTIGLTAGDTVLVSGIHEGAKASFTETVPDGYQASFTVDGQEQATPTASIVEGKVANIAYVNHVPETPPSPDKTATNGKGEPTAPVKVKEGEQFSYVVSATNNNNNVAIENVVVYDKMPAGVTISGAPSWYVDNDSANMRAMGSNVVYNGVVDGVASFNVARIEANQAVRIVIPVTVDTGFTEITRLDNEAWISYNGESEHMFTYHEVEPEPPTDPEDAKVQLQATKRMADGSAPALGAFAFQLLDEQGETVALATNDAQGNVVFPEITYSQAGTYAYLISEIINSGLYVFDTQVHVATVEVVQEEGGALKAQVTYSSGEPPVFVNEPDGHPNSTTVENNYQVPAVKTVNGAAPGDARFTFKMESVGDTPEFSSEAQNNAAGAIVFNAVSFGESDIGKTYEYKVSEINDGQEGYTYDTSEYQVFMRVFWANETEREIGIYTWTTKNGQTASTIAFENPSDQPPATPEENPPTTTTDNPPTTPTPSYTPATPTTPTTYTPAATVAAVAKGQAPVKTGDVATFGGMCALAMAAALSAGLMGASLRRGRREEQD